MEMTPTHLSAASGEGLVVTVDLTTDAVQTGHKWNIAWEDSATRTADMKSSLPTSLANFITNYDLYVNTDITTILSALMMHPAAGPLLVAFMAAGETVSGFIGPGETSPLKDTTGRLKKTFRANQIKVIGVASGYPTLQEVPEFISSLVSKYSLTDWITEMSVHCQPVVATAAWMSIFRSWFMSTPRREILRALSQLRVDLSKALIQSVQEQDGKLVVTWTQAFTYKHADPTIDEVSRSLYLNMVREWLIQNEEGAVKQEWGGFKFQTINPDSLLYKWFITGTGGTIKFGDHEEVYTGDDISSLDGPSDDSEITLADSTEIADANPNIVTVIKPSLWSDATFDAGHCPKLEDNANCLGLASELGVISQSRLDKLEQNLFSYQDLKAKALKKQYNLKKVKIPTSSDLQREMANIDIPDFRRSSFEALLYATLDANRKIILEHLDILDGGTLKDGVPVYEAEDGTKYIIVQLPEPLALSATPYSIRNASTDQKDPTPDAGLQFWKDMTGPTEVSIFVCPVSQLTATTKSQATSGLWASDIAVGGWLPNARPVERANAATQEYAHCIDRYKLMVREGYGGPGDADPDDKSYWWLLLLIIPLIGLFLLIGKAMRKSDEQKATSTSKSDASPSPTENQGPAKSSTSSERTKADSVPPDDDNMEIML